MALPNMLSGSNIAKNAFNAHTQGERLVINGENDDKEIARINLRATEGCGIKVIGNLICRVYREQGYYKLCVSAKEHPGFEACDYEASACDTVGMLAMNSILEQLRADCEWLDSMPEGALLEPGQSVLMFLLTYMGNVLTEHVPGQVPERLQRALDRIQNTQTAVMVGESIGSSEARGGFHVSTPKTFVSADEHHVFVNDTLVSTEDDGILNDLKTPIIPHNENTGENKA